MNRLHCKRSSTSTPERQLGQNKPPLSETVFVLAVALVWDLCVYFSSSRIAKTWHHYDMTLPIDGLVPFLPWTVCIYFACFLFWGFNYYLCAVQDRSERDRFFLADFLAKGICFVIFLVIPTTNIRPEIADGNLWNTGMKLLYQIDSADNLFPSIHCLASWLCWIGVRKRKDISVGYRWFSFAAAIATCICVLTTRQHVIVDVISGVLLAELCYFITGFPKIRAVYSALVARVFRSRSQ